MNTLYLPEIREMLAAADGAGLADFCSTLHPSRTAEYMEGLTPHETWEVLIHADVNTRVEIFGYLTPEKQIAMLETLDRKEMARLIGDLAPDDVVGLLEDVNPEIVAELLPLVPQAERRDIQRLQSFPENSAGRLMTTEFARLSEDMTVGQVQELFRRWGERPEVLETISYLYVVDSADHLRGVVSFREIAFAALIHHDPQKKVSDLMQRNVIAVRADDDQMAVVNMLADHDLVAVPVVDHDNHLIGIITHDDVLDVVREEAVDDALRSAGIQPLDESYLETPLLSLTWRRAVWLALLFVAALFTTTALKSYEEYLDQNVWLIMFLPMIASSGGNSGNQSATLIITALNSEEVELRDWKRILRREISMGLLLGSVLALIGFVISGLWTLNLSKGIVVAVTLLLVVNCGTVTGSMLPLLFRRLGLDPALMSNPFVAGVMDILSIGIYMTVASQVLR